MPSLRAATGGEKEGRNLFTDYGSVWNIVDRSNIVYEGQGKYSYSGSGSSSAEDVGLIKTLRPLDPSQDGGMSSFEVTVSSTGEKKFIAIGVCSSNYPSHSLPGWEKLSVGFHLDDASLLQSPNEAMKTQHEFREGDVIKCSIKDVPSETTQHAVVEVKFSCNNEHVISTLIVNPPGGFYGIIGMMSKGEAITLSPPVLSKRQNFSDVWEIANPDLVNHTQNGICKYVGPGDLTEHYIGTIRSVKPIEPLGDLEQRSFSLCILNPGEKSFIGIGIVSKTYPTGLLPGWEDTSIGYHADSGDIFHSSSDGSPTNVPCEKGDTMQCEVEGIDNSSKRIRVSFLRNGVKVKEVTDWTPSTGFYFSFGMMSKGEVVQVNLSRTSIPFLVPRLTFDDLWKIQNPSLQHSESGICRYVGHGKVGTVRSKEPIDVFSSANYYEVKILEPGRQCYIALGICSQHYSTDQLPGWEDLSVGYHADEGAIIQSSSQQKVGEPCTKGDVIRCTLDAVDGSDKQMNVGFHKNGSLLGKAVFWKPTDGVVYAQIGCMGEGEVIQIASPRQEVSHLQPNRPSMQSYSERSTSYVPNPQTGIQELFDHSMMHPARLAKMQHFFEMYSKFHSFVPSSDNPTSLGPGSMVAGNLTLPPMPLSSRESSHHTYDLSASYPTLPSQTSYSAQNRLQTQKSEPPFITQQSSYSSQKSTSSSSSVPSKSDMPYGPQFSVSSVSSLESVPEDDKITHHLTSRTQQYPLVQSMQPSTSQPNISSPQRPTSPPSLVEVGATDPSGPLPSLDPASQLPPMVTLSAPVTQASTGGVCVDRVILDKSENRLFKILNNVELCPDGSLAYARQNNNHEGSSFVMNRLPLNEKCNYFEIEILEFGVGANIAFGIVCDPYPIHCLPGALEGSVAYHTKDSCILHGGTIHQKDFVCDIGDVLGCQIYFPVKSEIVSLQGKDPIVSVKFFKNGLLMHSLEQLLPPNGFFPAVGATGSGWKITSHQNVFLKPETYFEKHPLPSGYLNFEMPSSESTLWHCVANSRVSDGLLFPSGVCCGKPGVVQSNLPFSHDSYYFQVRLLDDIISYSVLSIGIASKLSIDSKKVIPGEIANSVAYLPLLGFFMTSGVICWTAPSVVGSTLRGKDVTLGVGVKYPVTDSPNNHDSKKVTKLTQKIQLFFTINAQQVHDIFIEEPSDKIFPVFAFEHEGGRLSDPLATLEFPKNFPYVDTHLPFGFCRGKHPNISRLFDSSTVKSVPDVSVESNLPLHSIQASQPLSPSRSYFEIKVMDGGETFKISCGLAGFNYPVNIHPGWEKNSIALHIDDGNLFFDGNYSNVVVPPRYPGVRVGCGIRFSSSGSMAEVFFAVNKQIVTRKYIAVPQLGLFPTIGMRTRRGIVEVNIHALDPFPLISFRSEIEIQHNVIIEGSCIQLQSSSNPGAVQMKNFDFQNMNHFIEVTCLSERNGRIMVGYSTNKSCPLNFLKSQAFKACVVDVVSGKQMIYNEYYKSRDSCLFSKNSVVGIGLEQIPNSNMLLLFFVSSGYIVSYTEIDIDESGIYPCLLMMDSTTKVDINWCSIWPKLTPIGYGWGAFVNLKLEDCKITHSGSQSKKRLPVGYAQASAPFSRFDCYFEVEICSRAVNKAIAIGLASRNHSTSQWIGWSENSIGYHTDDGKMFKESSSGQSFGPKAYAGDIIGCGARMSHICTKDAVSGSTKVKIEIFFCINGALLNTQKMAIPSGGLFPTICLESSSESVIFHRFKGFPPVSSLVDPEMWSNAYSVKQAGKVISNSCRHKEINGGLPKAFCQARLPFSPERPYFQVEIASLGTTPKGSVFVGGAVKIPVGCTTPNTHSVLYSTNGFILSRKASQKSSKASVKCDVGDIVGCLALFNNGNPLHLEIYLNHSKIFSISLTDLWTPQDIFPTVVLTHPGDSIIPDLQKKFPSWYTSPLIGWLRSERVKVHKNVIEYNGQAKTFFDIGVAQASQPLELNTLTYFEVEVISSAKYVMGVGIACSNYPLNRQPGWCKGSIAYHGDDGKLFHEDGSGVSFGPIWKQYDIIGVGMRPDYSQTNKSAQVFFCRNGKEVGHTTVDIPPNGLYPTVGFHNEGLKVKIILGEPGNQPCNMCPMRAQWRALVGINISKSSSGQLLKHCTNGRIPDPYLLSLAIYGQSFCDEMQYFEVKIHTMGPLGIAIGVVPQQYSLKQAPGWGASSVAYHTDNGQLYNAAPKGKPFGPIAHCGDSIGCGIVFHPNNTKFCAVFFTYNGTEIGRVKTNYQSELYPAVALTGSSDSVSIKVMETWKPTRVPLSDYVFVNLMRINNCSYADQIISYTGSGHSGSYSTPAIAQFSIPLSKSYAYYCASILDCNDDVFIGLAIKDYPLRYVPGTTSVSIAYDVKKGNVRAVFSSENFTAVSSETCKEGDIIGCGICYAKDSKKDSTYVFFTRNHNKLCDINVPNEILFEDLYPIVGFFPLKKSSFLFMHWNTFKFTETNIF